MSEYTITLGSMVITHGGPVTTGESMTAVPQSISRAQGKAVLIQMGLWGSVLSFVAAIPDPVERALAEVALHDTTTWQRTSPFLNAAAAALGLSGAQMDDLFTAAHAIAL